MIQSIVCATVKGHCLEYFGCITLFRLCKLYLLWQIEENHDLDQAIERRYIFLKQTWSDLKSRHSWDLMDQKSHVIWWTQIKFFPFQNLMCFAGPKTSCVLMDPKPHVVWWTLKRVFQPHWVHQTTWSFFSFRFR